MSEAKRSEATAIGGQIGAVLAREAALWVDAQRDLVTGFGRVMTDWIGRQRAAVETSSRAMQRMCECRNPVELLQVQQEWATDCLKWTTSQLGAAGEDARLVAQNATTRISEAARDTAEDVRRESGRRRPPGEPELSKAASVVE